MTRRRSAQQLLDLVLDPASFESWDHPIDITHHSAAYQDQLRAAAESAGTDESVRHRPRAWSAAGPSR